MVSTDKFYVYGGGRWREVDAGLGRIDGWGRAKFLVARGGKLEAARSAPVRAALRALAAGQPSAAREGPPLPYKEPAGGRRAGGEGGACCAHRHRSRTFTSKCSENKASVAIQCDTAETEKQTLEAQKPSMVPSNPTRDTSKRRRDSTSSEELFHAKVVTVATVHSPRRPHPKRRRIISSPDSPDGVLVRNPHSCSSSTNGQAPSLTSPVKSLKARRAGPPRRSRSASRESSPLLPRWQDKISKYLQPKKARKESETSARRAPRREGGKVTSSDDSAFEVSSKSRKQISKRLGSSDEPLTRKLGAKRALQRSHPGEPPNHKGSSQKVSERSATEPDKRSLVKAATKSSSDKSGEGEPAPQRTSSKESSSDKPIKRKIATKSTVQQQSPTEDQIEEKSQSQSSISYQVGSQQAAPKELVIDEGDVEVLRRYLQKHCSDEELLRFDADDEYKKLHFFRLNPLVSMQRCPRIDGMLRARSYLSLLDFASKLGLRSVSEASSGPRRYRTRRREEKRLHSDSGTEKPETNVEDKENMQRAAHGGSRRAAAVLRDSGGNAARGEAGSRGERAGREGAEETKPGMQRKPRPPVKRALAKEYSNLEDHAIVSWVSQGERARCVNGNRLWRELQDSFCRLTGRGRTWHSLRNRYLRYILPRLANLAVPPSQQARLRAAAATGELKARVRKEPRRNSIFELPPRGAASRLPPAASRLPPSTGREQPDASPARDAPRKERAGTPRPAPRSAPRPAPRAGSPRYSDVTRQFARRHRARALRTLSSEGSLTSPTNETPAETPPRKRSPSPRRKSSRRASPGASSHRSRRSKQRASPRGKSNRRESLSVSGREVSAGARSPSRERSSSESSQRESRSSKQNPSPRKKSNRVKSPSPSASSRDSDPAPSYSEASDSDSDSGTDKSEILQIPTRRSTRHKPNESDDDRRRSRRLKTPAAVSRADGSPDRTVHGDSSESNSDTSPRRKIKSPSKHSRNNSRLKVPEPTRLASASRPKRAQSPTRLLIDKRKPSARPRTRKLYNPRTML